MYRFEKKTALVCATASLIVACCLPLSANVAFAQDSVEAQSVESKADFPSVVSDDLQPDISSVVKDGWQRDESSGVWYYGKTVNTKPAGCKAAAIGIGLIQPVMAQCRQVISM